MTGSFSRGGGGDRYAYYHCRKIGCSNRISKKDLEEKFYELLNKMALNNRALEASLASITSEFDKQVKAKRK